jgi:hypothetical protein
VRSIGLMKVKLVPERADSARHAQCTPEHRARYLVLFGDEDAPRAALFDTHERLLAEMIGDDGYNVDNLIRASSACAPPRPAMLDALEALDRDADTARARCFKLG